MGLLMVGVVGIVGKRAAQEEQENLLGMVNNVVGNVRGYSIWKEGIGKERGMERKGKRNGRKEGRKEGREGRKGRKEI
jgi:hypothetical protein